MRFRFFISALMTHFKILLALHCHDA